MENSCIHFLPNGAQVITLTTHKMILTDLQINYLVKKINDKVNLPLLGEQGEHRVITKAIEKILNHLEDNLPEELLALINDASNGFLPGDAADAKRAKKACIRHLNNKVNIPLVSERKEQKLFTIVVENLFEAMKKGRRLAA